MVPPWWCVSGLQTTLGCFFLQTVIRSRLLFSPANGRERSRVHLKGISPSVPRVQLRSRLLRLLCLRIGVIAVQGGFQPRAQPVAVAVSLSWGHPLPGLLCPSHGGFLVILALVHVNGQLSVSNWPHWCLHCL